MQQIIQTVNGSHKETIVLFLALPNIYKYYGIPIFLNLQGKRKLIVQKSKIRKIKGGIESHLFCSRNVLQV